MAVGVGATAVAAVVALPVMIAPGPLGDWLALSPEMANKMRRTLPADCMTTAGFATVGIALALWVRRGRIGVVRATALLLGLIAADLARAGAGINPQVSRGFFELLPEIGALHLDQIDGGRVFSYGAYQSPLFRLLIEKHEPGTGLWSFFVNRQTLSPFNNVIDRVETAEGSDRTSFLPVPPTVGIDEYDPGAIGSILPRLRAAAVSRIVSLDPLDHAELRLIATVSAGPPGVAIRVYEVLQPWPRAYVACRVLREPTRERALRRPLAPEFDPNRDVVLEDAGEATCRDGTAGIAHVTAGRRSFEVVSDGRGYLVMRDSYARGWTARVDGTPAAVVRANGKHRAVPVEEGRHHVVLTYHPPGLWTGLAVTVAAALAALVLWRFPPMAAEPDSLPSSIRAMRTSAPDA